ncbi:TPA: hypothetical protein JLR01_004412 [Escherichia coli]|nr:hypothetical protein [Escherichia coli]HBB9798390.1 hypothetical protein [Escherichia coli]
MTSSGQSHQLSTGTVLKPDLTSRVFLRLSFGCTSVFSPSFDGAFSFSFFVAVDAAGCAGQLLDADAGIFMILIFSVSYSTQGDEKRSQFF